MFKSFFCAVLLVMSWASAANAQGVDCSYNLSGRLVRQGSPWQLTVYGAQGAVNGTGYSPGYDYSFNLECDSPYQARGWIRRRNAASGCIDGLYATMMAVNTYNVRIIVSAVDTSCGLNPYYTEDTILARYP